MDYNKLDFKSASSIIINSKGDILSFKRAPYKKLYPNKWDVVCGKFKEGEDAQTCLLREVWEETGIKEFLNIERGDNYIFTDNGISWLVHPFRCLVRDDVSVKLNHEHTEYKWMSLDELLKKDCPPPLFTDLKCFYQGLGYYV